MAENPPPNPVHRCCYPHYHVGILPLPHHPRQILDERDEAEGPAGEEPRSDASIVRRGGLYGAVGVEYGGYVGRQRPARPYVAVLAHAVLRVRGCYGGRRVFVRVSRAHGRGRVVPCHAANVAWRGVAGRPPRASRRRAADGRLPRAAAPRQGSLLEGTGSHGT